MKKTILLLGCMLLFLIACQQAEPEEEKSEEAFNESEPKEMEEAVSLPEADLQKGDESEDVVQLQEILNQLGYPIEATGRYEDLTTWAITDIQLQIDALSISGIYDEATKQKLETLLDGEGTVTAGSQLVKPAAPNEYPDIIENPYDVLALVNKNHALPNDYEPIDLVVPDIRFPFKEDVPKKQLRQIAADALETLFAAADADNIHLFAQSGYRSYDRQEAIFASNAAKNGEEHANTYSARAGESEHQTGLVMDVTSQEVGFGLITDFGNTKEGKWLREHAHEFGYIIRYPEGKEHITEYQYEPWHLRYVGKKAAATIFEQNITLEEYFAVD